jgi:GT2 family glycosyltransferase
LNLPSVTVTSTAVITGSLTAAVECDKHFREPRPADADGRDMPWYSGLAMAEVESATTLPMPPTASRPRVGVIILHWGSPEFTVACLRSLEALDDPAREFLVVDNSPDTGLADLMTEHPPGLTVIRPGTNRGFAGGNNVGLRHFQERDVDYVLLLNNDTEVAPDFLRRLVQVGESEPAIGILGPRIDYFGHPDLIWSTGGMVDPYGFTRHLGLNERRAVLPEGPCDVDYVTGCAMLVKRQAIETIGGLDERFFLYFEETEWCARARRAGYRVCCVPTARIWHKIEPESRAQSPRTVYYMTRNRLLYLQCRGAGPRTIGVAALKMLRPAVPWLLRPKHRDRRPYAKATFLGVRDYLRGQFGPAPSRLVEAAG